MYQVVRIMPPSIIFQHGEYRELLSEHSYFIMAWLVCYLWHNTRFLPCYIEKKEVGE